MLLGGGKAELILKDEFETVGRKIGGGECA